MGLFGKMFDFDRDGETSLTEEALGLGIVGAFLGAAAEEDEAEAAGQEEEEQELEDDLLAMTGYDRFDLEQMDEDERREVLEDAGFDPDEFDLNDW